MAFPGFKLIKLSELVDVCEDRVSTTFRTKYPDDFFSIDRVMWNNWIKVRTDKQFCTRCLMPVNPNKHAASCKKPSKGPANLKSRVWNKEKKSAWLGDSRQVLDVRFALELSNIASTERGPKLCDLISATSHYKFCLNHAKELGTPNDTNKNNVSDWLEANYTGKVRDCFLRVQFPFLNIPKFKLCILLLYEFDMDKVVSIYTNSTSITNSDYKSVLEEILDTVEIDDSDTGGVPIKPSLGKSVMIEPIFDFELY